jgi:hypothetical protein
VITKICEGAVRDGKTVNDENGSSAQLSLMTRQMKVRNLSEVLNGKCYEKWRRLLQALVFFSTALYYWYILCICDIRHDESWG